MQLLVSSSDLITSPLLRDRLHWHGFQNAYVSNCALWYLRLSTILHRNTSRTAASRCPTRHVELVSGRQPTPKMQSLLSQERLKLRTASLADPFTGSIRTQAREKFWRKGSVGVSRDCPNFFEYLLLSQEQVKLQTSNFVRPVLVSIGKKAHYEFGEK